jgi:glycosyltransferase involved in cell wall biosynthesis
VLLFPSLSEGSALVTLEAAATGLPVIATPEAGAPSSSMVIEAASSTSIRDSLERILDDRALLSERSERTLQEAARRTEESFLDGLGRLMLSSVAATERGDGGMPR